MLIYEDTYKSFKVSIYETQYIKIVRVEDDRMFWEYSPTSKQWREPIQGYSELYCTPSQLSELLELVGITAEITRKPNWIGDFLPPKPKPVQERHTITKEEAQEISRQIRDVINGTFDDD